MEVEFNELAVIRVKLDLEDMEILAAGEIIYADLDKCLQLEIFHSPSLDYGDTAGINGKEH